MPTEADDNLDVLLYDLLNQPSERWTAELERVTGSDSALRERLEKLLRTHRQAGGFLEKPALTVAEKLRTPEPLECPGTTIDRYKLLELIGEGGFGAVYMAQQTEPVRRKVALKIIKLGMDTKQVIARFEAERQALAMMDHPNIAKVLDAGATETGRPYFVMELVKGVPITDYCDSESLATSDRLDLMTHVCNAVQHAHQKGIIHRDIKPSNVMVTIADGRPIPKVIDFGIAKATDRALTDKTLFTEFRQLIGTPAYMSPEQAEMSGVDIDTRSDIYSLGVLLYELLTGTTPFDPERLRSAAFGEMQRIIREEEPDKPSTRVASDLPVRRSSESHPPGSGRSEPQAQAPGSSSPLKKPIASAQSSSAFGFPVPRSPIPDPSSVIDIAQHRRSDPRSLAKQLRGDLDWIVMKCLEKDRTRRYETANGVAADIQRHLHDEPVQAGPPTAAYRVRKFVRRNRAMVTAATMVVAALLAGTAGTTFGLLRAEQRRADAEAARGRERQQRDLAEKREKQTQQVSDFQFAMLSEIDVEAMGRGIKEHLREQVRAALKREYVGEFPDRRKRTPEEIEAELAAFDQRADLAQAVDVARGVMDEFVLARAADALEEQFGDQPLVQAQLHLAIGRTYRKLGLYNDAEPHLRAALEIRQRHYGPEHAHPELAECLYNLAGLIWDMGSVSEAETIYLDALAMWRELSDKELVARTLEALGGAVMFQRRFEEADSLLSEALQLNRELHGEDHPHFAGSLATMAVLRGKQDRHADAESINRQVLEWRLEHYGEQHEKVAHILFNLAYEVGAQDRAAEAEELFRESLAINRAVYGDEHPLVAKTLFQLGVQLVRQGRRQEGEDLYREALLQQRKLLGEYHRAVRQTLEALAYSRYRDRDFEECVALWREILAITEQAYPEGHPEAFRRFGAMANLGGVMTSHAKVLLSSDRERALALWEEAESIMSAGLMGMDRDPRSGSLENKRRSLGRTVKIYEFWHDVAPDGGWDVRAAEWRTELEKLDG